ncbi:MAG: flagellar biosynthesis regulator FlaF [Alphaproteobacteria bacterium]|nr:flagellar biosynthesis regulator FlaF [Alphaproteobacteria bacterium]
MNKEAFSAYNTHQRGDEDVRETEARALLSCANRLEAARQQDCSKEFFADALHHNQQLWTLFQACLCDPDNQLPRDLKVLLLNISAYVDKTTFRALGTRDKALLGGLVSINRNIANGLRKKTEETASSAMMTSQPDTMQGRPLVTSA